jgi:hypothetical protein
VVDKTSLGSAGLGTFRVPDGTLEVRFDPSDPGGWAEGVTSTGLTVAVRDAAGAVQFGTVSVDVTRAAAGDADVLSYLAAVETADGQALETGVADAVDALVAGLKADGVWADLTYAAILAGPRTLAGAIVPLKGDAPTSVGFGSGDLNRATGLLGDGAGKRLTTAYLENDFPANDRHAAVWMTEADTRVGIGRFLISAGAGAPSILLGDGGGGANLRIRFVSSTTRSAGSNFDFFVPGLIGATRSSAASYTVRSGASLDVINDASVSPQSGTFEVLDGGAARVAWVSLGAATDLGAVRARVGGYLDAIGAIL